MQDLLDILAWGDDAQVAHRIYGSESLTEDQCLIPLALLRALRAPRPGLRLSVVERHASGRFELLILRVPWLETEGKSGSGYRPLLVAEQVGTLRALGYVLPWNEILGQLGAEMASVMPLSLVWILRLQALKGIPGRA
jgi:hypothetical protein